MNQPHTYLSSGDGQTNYMKLRSWGSRLALSGGGGGWQCAQVAQDTQPSCIHMPGCARTIKDDLGEARRVSERKEVGVLGVRGGRGGGQWGLLQQLAGR